METDLKGKTVLITDASNDFGPALARAFAQEGADLVLNVPPGAGSSEESVSLQEDLGVEAVECRFDVSRESDVASLLHTATERFGKIDVVVNNGFYSQHYHPLSETSWEMWEHKIRVEVTGALLVCQAALPGMVERKWGRIINFMGTAGFDGADASAAATGLGLVGLTRGIAREYGAHGITANCIGLGDLGPEEQFGGNGAPKNSNPIPRWGTPKEAAFLAVSLTSPDSGYITGQCLLVNGGKYFL